MAFLTYLLVFVEALCSVLLVGVILIQRTKGQGMGAAFGGGMGESLFGTQMGNVLTKTTVVLAIIFLVNTTVLAYLNSTRAERTLVDDIPEAAATAPAAPTPQPVPDMPMTDGSADTMADADLPVINVEEVPPAERPAPQAPAAPAGAE